MEAYKQEFIEFMVDCQVLKFGEFTLKSGRKSPFFMNAGAYVTGSQLMGLGEYYAKAIHNTYGDDFDVLFGPAYKGIPISVVTAIAYSKLYRSRMQMDACRNDCVCIELASKNGIEYEDIIIARGLPGIHLPESSGNLIAETFLRYYKKEVQS